MTPRGGPAVTARLVAIMGSGETSPTMVKTHRALLARLGPAPVPAALLDTPFGFQSNADDIVARAVRYFRQSVGQELTVASFRSAAPDPLEHQTMLRRLEEARYVFAGPGSPSYALRLWKASPVPGVLADKLRSGGCLTFASAAALTLGAATVPVYEIYKVGEDPHWLEGLDLLAEAGLPGVAVVPHFNNAEGGTHDTRFCYLGEERLARMEAQLPTGSFVLGVDEHTALVLDLDEGTASVGGMGVVTVRSSGRSTEIPAGEKLATSELAAMGGGGPGPVRGAPRSGGTGSPAGVAPEPRVPPAPAPAPLADAVEAHRSAFDAALAGGDVSGAVRTTLELDEDLAAWAADTTQSDEMDRARSALRSLIARLGEAGSAAASDPTETVAPFVELLLRARARARAEGRWSDADAVRDGLVALGVEVQDGPEGTVWRLLS